MKLENIEAKFNLTTKVVLKNDIVKKAKVSKLDIDTLLDDYICNDENLENIHHLIEQSLNSDLQIDSIDFVENETLIDTYDDEVLDIICQCIVKTEKPFYKNVSGCAIREHLEDVYFWSDEKNISVEDCRLTDFR